METFTNEISIRECTQKLVEFKYIKKEKTMSRYFCRRDDNPPFPSIDIQNVLTLKWL